MLPAQPPHSRRISPIWNDTDSMCVWSGRMCRAKRSGNTMMVSKASEPQISVRMVDHADRAVGSGEVQRRGSVADRAPRSAGARRAAASSVAAVAVSADDFAADLADDRIAGGATPAASRRRRAAALPSARRRRRSTRRSKPRIASRATRQLRCTRTKRAPNSSSSWVSDSSSRYSRCGGADRDVLELGLEVDDLVDRHEHDARALGHRQEAPRGRPAAASSSLGGQRLQPRHLLQRGEQALHAHRLHQVVDRVAPRTPAARARGTRS